MKNFLLTGKVYEVEPSFYQWDSAKQYPFYKAIAVVSLGIHQFANLSEAEMFFEKHYGALKKGGSIVIVDNEGNPIPCENGGGFVLYAEKGAEE